MLAIAEFCRVLVRYHAATMPYTGPSLLPVNVSIRICRNRFFVLLSGRCLPGTDLVPTSCGMIPIPQTERYAKMPEVFTDMPDTSAIVRRADRIVADHSSDPGHLFGTAHAWMVYLQDAICKSLEGFERHHGFERRTWKRQTQAGPDNREPQPADQDPGGGTSATLRGDQFEKAGVNVSSVAGTISPAFQAEVRGSQASGGNFRATGLSLVIHPRNPYIPPIHMNTRIIETSVMWFGGGIDLNPIFPDATETAFFKNALRAVCEAEQITRDCYKEFSDTCDRYFHIPHRNEARGEGGIFFDHFGAGQPDRLDQVFRFIQRLGASFIPIYEALTAKNMDTPWTETDRAEQLRRRGRYVEFNLLYDRGTRFGLKTGADSEALLMSLPPVAAWP